MHPLSPPAAGASLLSEEELLNCKLQHPILRNGNLSYAKSKAGSIPFDPDLINKVTLSDFEAKHASFSGRNEKLPNTLPPIDWRNPLFSENDNRADLQNKVYLPLSRVLKPRGICFGQDSPYIQREGSEDSVVVTAFGEVRVVIEEKSESMMQALLPPSSPADFHYYCVSGRQGFLRGKRTKTDAPAFACPLILAQLLGYMHLDQVCRGIIFTSGRAYFVWIDVPQRPQRTAAKKPKRSSNVFLTEKVSTDHPNFLRILASFLVESFGISEEEGIETSELLAVQSSEGGFSKGAIQKHDLTPKNPNKTTSAGATSKPPAASMSLGNIPQLSKIPEFAQVSLLAATLGRERCGKVIKVKWNDVYAAVKIVYIDKEDGDYALKVFKSEVEAYRLAGAAGLWGIAVPQPLFVASDDKTQSCLGTSAGEPMPLDPLEWKEEELRQAKESVMLLSQAGVGLSDIKPANFVKLLDQSVNCSAAAKESRVAAIDLECYFEDESPVEMPLWLVHDSPSLISCSE